MDIWQELHRFAVSRAPQPIDTTLLGDVPYKLNSDGTTTSIVPQWLAENASRHGMVVIDADWKRGAYTLQLTQHTNPLGAN